MVWAHNSHIGDARFTDMGAERGELNIGQLCRRAFRPRSGADRYGDPQRDGRRRVRMGRADGDQDGPAIRGRTATKRYAIRPAMSGSCWTFAPGITTPLREVLASPVWNATSA